jgi:hypothetical protein
VARSGVDGGSRKVHPSGPAGSTNTMTFTGNLTGPSAVAPFPTASSTFPNGGLINFSGAIYVFAGSKAFGIPSPTVLNKIRSVNHALVLNAAPGSTVPGAASSRSGTLITTQTVNGNPTIYVVGTDGPVARVLHPGPTPVDRLRCLTERHGEQPRRHDRRQYRGRRRFSGVSVCHQR